MENVDDQIPNKNEGEEKIDKDWILAEISKRGVYDFIGVIKEKKIPPEIIQSPEVQQAAKEGMIKRLSRGEINDSIKIKETFNVSEELTLQAAKEGMVRALSWGSIEIAIFIKEALNVSEEIIQSPEVQQAAKGGMIEELSVGRMDDAIEIKDKFNFSEDTFVDLIRGQVIRFLYSGNRGIAPHYRVSDFLEKLNISIDSIKNPEMEERVKMAVIRELSTGEIGDALSLKKFFNISKETIDTPEFQETIEKTLIKLLSGSRWHPMGSGMMVKDALRMIDDFSVSQEMLQAPDLYDTAKRSMRSWILEGDLDVHYDLALRIKNYFEIPEKEVEGCLETLIIWDRFERIDLIKNKFGITEEKIKELATNQFHKRLSDGTISGAEEIVNKFNLDTGTMMGTIISGMQNLLLKEKIVSIPEIAKKALEIKTKFNVSNQDTGEILKNVLIKRDNYKYYFQFKNIFNLSDSFAEDGKIKILIKKWILELLNESSFYDMAIRLMKEIKDNSVLLESEEVQSAAKKAMEDQIKEEDSLAAGNIAREFNLAESDVQEIVEKWILNRLDQNHIFEVISLKNNFNISEDFIKSPEVQKMLKSSMLGNLNWNEDVTGNIRRFKEIQKEFLIDDETTNEIALKSIGLWISSGRIDIAIKIKEHLNLSGTDIKVDLIKLIKLDELPLGNLIETEETKKFFTENILGLSWKYIETLSLGENILIKKRLVEENGLDLNKIDEHEIEYDPQTENDYEYIFENIKNMEDSVWTQEDHEIKEAFETGALYFGYKKMFKFMGGKNHHDRLFAFKKIVGMAQKSGLTPEQFYANVLLQVQHDTGNYGETEEYVEEDEYEMGEVSQTIEIDSYQKLNNIADVFNDIDVLEKIKKAREYDIQKIRDLVDAIEKPGDIFVNWKSLKNFADLVELLNKTQILEQLEGLSGEKGEKLKNYVEYLAFHPNINTQAVIDFWQRPGEFLGVGDEHSSQTHELKKPSNYVEIPYIDLSPEDLRDALVEGSLDRIQAWQPLEIEYKIPTGEIADLTIVEQMKKGLGSRREKIPGIAKNPGLLFKQLNDLFKKEGIKFMDVLTGKVEIPETLNESLESTLYDEEYGLVVPTKEYRFKIGLKSDPEIVVAGNDTACCMPFGSGKNNVYMYNPVCGQLVVQRKVGDSWRTVAQSVVTKDKDIKKNVSDIIAEFNGNERHSLHEIFSEDILIGEKDIMTCDNIEVSPNYTDTGDLEALYRDFFQEYGKRFGESENLDTERLIVGTGYADATFGQSVDNTFVPVAPVGYSDNVGASSKMVSLSSEGGSHLRKKVNIKERPYLKESEPEINGISSLTHTDTLPVSYIEGKAYDDNSSLKEYLHNMENGLIAKDILNSHFDLPEMSFKYVDQEKKTQGYLLAYEGFYDQERIIYISDLAANPESKLAGGRLIKSFVEKYKREYLDKDRFIPIFTNARDKTSYKIITKQLDKISEELGVKFELEEVGSYDRGGEEMHNLIIRPVRV